MLRIQFGRAVINGQSQSTGRTSVIGNRQSVSSIDIKAIAICVGNRPAKRAVYFGFFQATNQAAATLPLFVVLGLPQVTHCSPLPTTHSNWILSIFGVIA